MKLSIALAFILLLLACKGPWDSPFTPGSKDYESNLCEGSVTCDTQCETRTSGQAGDDASPAGRTCTYSCDGGRAGEVYTSCWNNDCDEEESRLNDELSEEITCEE